MIATTVTKKGQVTIPKEIRDSLGLKEHDKVIFIRKGTDIVLRPVRGTILDLRGTVQPKERPERFDRIRNHIKKARSKELIEDL